MIKSYTGASVDIKFEPFDEEGNNMLYIHFQRGDEPTLYMGDINLLLSKKIPAHIQYQAAVTYHSRSALEYGAGITGTAMSCAARSRTLPCWAHYLRGLLSQRQDKAVMERSIRSRQSKTRSLALSQT